MIEVAFGERILRERRKVSSQIGGRHKTQVHGHDGMTGIIIDTATGICEQS